MSEAIQEFVDSRGVDLKVDKEQGIIRGVKILGLESRNGRRYEAKGVREAAGLYEGAKVNVNHPKGSPTSPRDYQDRIGQHKNVHFREGEGLFGDFHYNPKHALAEQLEWDAEHAAENVGFSHNVQASTSRKDGKAVVETILKVTSVDLVADPATTAGLYEYDEGANDMADKQLTESDVLDFLKDNPSVKEKVIESAQDGNVTMAELRRKDQLIEQRDGEIAELSEQVRVLEDKLKVEENRKIVNTAISRSHLPHQLDTDHFRETAYRAFDEGGMDALEVHINDRRLAGRTGPRSRGTAQTYTPVETAEDFLAAIT